VGIRARLLALALALAPIASACDEARPLPPAPGSGADAALAPIDAGGPADAADPEDAAPGPDSGPAVDAGVTVDAGTMPEAGVASDAGGSPADATTPDAVALDAAGLDAALADAGPGDAAPPDVGSAVDAGAADAGVAVDAGHGPPDPGALPRLAFPIPSADRGLMQASPIFHVDHDPMAYSGLGRAICRNYEDRGFPWCYDGHEGSDFILDGGFTTMDAGSARVVAAAGGVVTRAVDGHYDRCHADLVTQDVSCDGRPIIPNLVEPRHADGWVTQYLHLKAGSVAVSVGDRVPCGAVLGRVGSSGYSSAPHLHLEVHDPMGRVWDPFAGARSQPESLWITQRASDGLPGDVCDPRWGPPPP
jgi:murein DD-endopeptidase MepM/ murein hydrolase activator NlpD